MGNMCKHFEIDSLHQVEILVQSVYPLIGFHFQKISPCAQYEKLQEFIDS